MCVYSLCVNVVALCVFECVCDGVLCVCACLELSLGTSNYIYLLLIDRYPWLVVTLVTQRALSIQGSWFMPYLRPFWRGYRYCNP